MTAPTETLPSGPFYWLRTFVLAVAIAFAMLAMATARADKPTVRVADVPARAAAAPVAAATPLEVDGEIDEAPRFIVVETP